MRKIIGNMFAYTYFFLVMAFATVAAIALSPLILMAYLAGSATLKRNGNSINLAFPDEDMEINVKYRK